MFKSSCIFGSLSCPPPKGAGKALIRGKSVRRKGKKGLVILHPKGSVNTYHHLVKNVGDQLKVNPY